MEGREGRLGPHRATASRMTHPKLRLRGRPITPREPGMHAPAHLVRLLEPSARATKAWMRPRKHATQRCHGHDERQGAGLPARLPLTDEGAALARRPCVLLPLLPARDPIHTTRYTHAACRYIRRYSCCAHGRGQAVHAGRRRAASGDWRLQCSAVQCCAVLCPCPSHQCQRRGAPCVAAPSPSPSTHTTPHHTISPNVASGQVETKCEAGTTVRSP